MIMAAVLKVPILNVFGSICLVFALIYALCVMVAVRSGHPVQYLYPDD
jgi:hypothetical protein